MFLNDFENFLLNENNFGLNIFDRSLQDYLKQVILLYADDTVLFAENEEEPQQLLNKPAIAAMHGPHILVRIGD